MPKCAVIIPVYNKASLTQQCLDALLARPPEHVAWEIIVVDDQSTDGTPQLLEGYGDRIRVLRHTTNSGFATACNDGAAAASSEYLVFLNNDTIPQPGWLDALVRYADAHPAAAAFGSKLLYPDGTIQHAGVTICQDRYARHIYAGFPADHPAVNKSRRYQIVTAACILLRRHAFEQAHGFDTAFVNGNEDVDLCLRLGQNGHEVHYCHESVLYHLESVSPNRFKFVDHNTKLYRERWAHRVRPDDLHYYFDDGLLDIHYQGEQYPVHMVISPQLAVIAQEERERQADRLLAERSRRLLELLKDNIRLNLRVQEAEFQPAPATKENGHVTEANGRRPAPSPVQLVCQGQAQWLSEGCSDRMVSVVIPVKNGGARLRELLPRLLSQRSRDLLEIIAVDSGSSDDSVDVLCEFRATVLSIDPRSFNHGMTRNLASSYAQGSVLVFVNQNTLPVDDQWLANLIAPLDSDPEVAGVCSRVLPRQDADFLTRRDGLRDPSGSADRSIRAITNQDEYRRLSPHDLRLFIRFHTVSAAIRLEVFQRIPFREIAFGEDALWGKDVLEAGHKIQHEPSAAVYHSHNYSFLELLRRNYDDGRFNQEQFGRQLPESELLPHISWMVREDWRYLEQECRLEGKDLERWRLIAALRRTAQMMGQWLGASGGAVTGDIGALLSLTQRIKGGASTEAADAWQV
jgi:GT2 family glycosyltransferase